MSFTDLRYVVITPVRDEEAHLRSTIQSMASQIVLPVQWIIVDDGSTDRTGEIIDEAASQYPWIRALHRKDRGYRRSGSGVVEAFKAGFRELTVSDWQFIVKLDGDLSFEPAYFDHCFARFRQDPTLGIAGGTICHQFGTRTVVEACPEFHVRGATKIYRRACWDSIGGLLPEPGWDTFDEVKANYLGWSTRTFPDLLLIHHRFTGAADGQWRNWIKNGRGSYVCGYHPLFMLAKCIRRVAHRPYGVAAAGLMYGYVSSYIRRLPRTADKEIIKYIRREQLSRMFGRKTVWR